MCCADDARYFRSKSRIRLRFNNRLCQCGGRHLFRLRRIGGGVSSSESRVKANRNQPNENGSSREMHAVHSSNEESFKAMRMLPLYQFIDSFSSMMRTMNAQVMESSRFFLQSISTGLSELFGSWTGVWASFSGALYR